MSSNTSVGGGGSIAGRQSIASTVTSKAKSETVNYLLLYEAMVRHQDLEFDATHDHMALTVERIQHLGRKSKSLAKTNAPPALVNETSKKGRGEEDAPKGMLTYLQMRRCLLRLGYTWNRSFPPPSSSNSSTASSNAAAAEYYDDDVSVMSANSASTGRSANSVNNARDIIATDAQLIMLLTTLVEMEERHRAVKLALEDDDDDDDEKVNEEDEFYSQGLFLPEFIQAYKLIIGGMQSLQTYPSMEAGDSRDAYVKACAALGLRPDDDGAASLQELRARSRERTLGLLRLFGPDASLYKEDPYQDSAQQPAGESSGKQPRGKKSSRDGLKNNQRAIVSSTVAAANKKPARMAADGLSPRLTEEEIRKLVHSKDAALAQILEDHESEMNVMATNMEQLRLRGIAQQKMLAKRRKRTRIAAAVGFLLLLAGGGIYEYHKREQVKVEIATGREAERRADAATIAALEGSVKSLKSKLADAEAAIRYEESRHDDVSKKYEKLVKQYEESEVQFRVDQRELEKCRVTRKELDVELTGAKARVEEVEEEVGWCRQRLENAERAMEGLERALKKSKQSKEEGKEEDGDAVKTAAAAVDAKDGEKEDKDAEEDKGKKMGLKAKPVMMEMKYNKAFRTAVILRQVYSAVGGMVISALLPPVFKAFGLFI
eukprot:CAMPEP_0183733630 /NCGR_PEP_ID=MMETSP0737-20130205/41607_1 /TAXON_ID=385413 /ORGANISM="Thalassiosira miniscula, Strain CCMP1093" /LENGTH=659 /DNA_ID=CAMNT_0025966917 /DNA_START=138 /DNA_END=2117 /DNA_ORIENTATION=+